MDALQVTARLAIHEGKLEEFKELAAQCMRLVRDRDSGTLQYDWFFNDNHTECVVRETYKDSGAVLEHIANLGPTFGAVLGVCDMALEVYGSPSDALVKATAGLAVNATHVVHSGVSGNNGGYHTNPRFLEGLPNESSS